MEPACLRYTEIPHTSRLFADFLYNYSKVEDFYSVPAESAWPEERRSALVAALREQGNDASALERLSGKGAVAVVTGQQVGLFSGPAYTVYKALTAARIAADLNSQGQTAVPVFWLATEDHDWAEVDHTWVADASHQPVKLTVEAERSGSVPVGNVSVAHWPLNELRAALREFPFADDVCDLVESTHANGARMGDSFRAFLQALLKPFGFLFLDPLHSSIRRLAAPLLQRAAGGGSELTQALLGRNRELESRGYHAQVHVDARTSLFFVLDNGVRLPIRDLKRPLSEIAEHAEDLSPNALLRPVVQDYLLPTHAYIGGPAEIAYFAQSQVLYQELLGYMPSVVPRNAYTLLDSRTVRILSRYNLHLRDLFGGEEALRERIASALVPPDLEMKFDSVTKASQDAIDDLYRSVASFDPTLGAAMQKSRSKILHQLNKSKARLARAILQRDERARAEAAYLYSGLFPQKHLQERFYSILPFLAQYGLGLVERLYQHAHTDCPDHVLLPL